MSVTDGENIPGSGSQPARRLARPCGPRSATEFIAEQAVVRPVFCLSAIMLLSGLFIGLSIGTKEAFPEGDIDMWPVRDSKVMMALQAAEAAAGWRELFLESENRMETEEEHNRRQRKMSSVHSDWEIRRAFFGETREKTQLGGRTQIVYRMKDGSNIFTARAAREVCKLERLWHEHGYDDDPEGFYHSPSRLSNFVQTLAGNNQRYRARWTEDPERRGFTFPSSDCESPAVTDATVQAAVRENVFKPYMAGDTGFGFFFGKNANIQGRGSGFSAADGSSFYNKTIRSFPARYVQHDHGHPFLLYVSLIPIMLTGRVDRARGVGMFYFLQENYDSTAAH